MIGTSLSDDGVELLGQRRGLDAYVSNAQDHGHSDPLSVGEPVERQQLWRRRRGGDADARAPAVCAPTSTACRSTACWRPIPSWLVTDSPDNAADRRPGLRGASRDCWLSFPFPHVLTLDITLADRTLTVETTVTPTTAASVPLCFGFHPYLHASRTCRGREWTLQTPPMRHLPVDAWGIPTGDAEDVAGAPGEAGRQVFDDGFDEVPQGAVFALCRRRPPHRGASSTRGIPAAQIFAPGNDDVVCIEPMAAPTDALRAGNYRCVQPPASRRPPRFSIRIVRRSLRRLDVALSGAAARPPAPCSSAPPRDRGAGWRATLQLARSSPRPATAAPRPDWSAR